MEVSKVSETPGVLFGFDYGALVEGRGVWPAPEVGTTPAFDADQALEEFLAGLHEESEIAGTAGGFVDARNDDESAVTLEQRVSAISKVMQGLVTQEMDVESKVYSGDRFERRCFSVEWRNSVLLDVNVFLQGLVDLVGSESSFVLGINAGGSRADYFVVVRRSDRLRLLNWKNKLMFGYGADARPEGEGEDVGLFVRVLVPSRDSAEGTEAFVGQMLERCNTYPMTKRYGETGVVRKVDRSYARPGKKKRADTCT